MISAMSMQRGQATQRLWSHCQRQLESLKLQNELQFFQYLMAMIPALRKVHGYCRRTSKPKRQGPPKIDSIIHTILDIEIIPVDEMEHE